MRKSSAVTRRWEASRGTLAAMLAMAAVAAPGHALAQFAGTPTVTAGSATFNTVGNTQTVTLGTATQQTIINWVPTDTATSAAPINFQSANTTVNFTAPGSTFSTYSVLNRILPTDATRQIGLNGNILSSANTRVWFYTPGGFLIGSSATFNVGGLVLTTADPVTSVDGNGNTIFITSTSGTDTFSVAGAAGSQSAITIQPGAQITVNGVSGNSTYMVAIAPQINNAGTINVAGSTALVAAESASFAVDPTGLFNIQVSAGSTVSSNTFVSTGSVGSTDSVANGAAQIRRVYMVAVPKNNAITMAISSGGTIGFATAGAAAMDGNEVVLSAGENINDTGTGNPTNGTAAGSGSASLTVGGGTYSSNTYAVSTSTATISDAAVAANFSSNLNVFAPQATVNANAAAVQVAGNLTVSADNTGLANSASSNIASVSVGPTATLTVGSNAAALGVNGDLSITANDALGAIGGTAQLNATGSQAITVAGSVSLGATASWANAPANANPGGITTTGGTAQIYISNGATLTIGGTLSVDASANGTNAGAVYLNSGFGPPDIGINAIAGNAIVTTTSPGSMISASGGLSVLANAQAGSDASVGNGGTANGGTVSIAADSGATLQIGATGVIIGSAIATGGTTTTANGGIGIGGSVSLMANGGTVTMQGPAAITLAASATGGSGYNINGLFVGGAAYGGTVNLGVSGAGGTIVTDTTNSAPGTQGMVLDASATGGGISETGAGGAATGGTVTINAGGTGSISLQGIPSLLVMASAAGGAGFGNGGGVATGGNVNVNVTGSTFTTAAAAQFGALAAGGSDYSAAGGNAVGGNVQMNVTNGGSLEIDGGTQVAVSATGGPSTSAGGGNAQGGNVLVTAVGATQLDLAFKSGDIVVDTSATGGNGVTTGTISSAGGARYATDGDLTLTSPVALIGDTSLVIKAGGNLKIQGTVTGTGNGAYLQLWADDLGTGTGTVTLAPNAINLTGTGAAVDIDYNPTALGTPTDYTPGVMAGTLTAYQLVDNVNQLQLISSYLSQNFALGKDIDASATQGWNAGAGFVPITPFKGNFDGLNHTITNLTINNGINDDTGLFGIVGANLGSNIIVRNLGLVNETVTGTNYVGGLTGAVGADNVMISNVYSTGSTVTGQQYIGGLIGVTISSPYNISLTGAHFNGTVTASQSYAGGLIGQDATGNIANSFSTGSVSGVSAIGGLIGLANVGTISQVYSTANVSTPASGSTLGTFLGGLVGSVISAGVTINGAYATGSVTAGTGSTGVGGLVGQNLGTITNSWASGAVSAPSGSGVGGFAGVNSGSITNAYWDEYSTGQSSGIGTDSSGTTSLNPVSSSAAQITAGIPSAFLAASYTNLTSGAWVYDAGITRPIGQWEVPVAQYVVATVNSAHQVQLIDQNLAGSYVVTQNIDMSGTAQLGDIWGGTGLIPITYEGPALAVNNFPHPFTGTIGGSGHVLSNLTINANFTSNTGLVSESAGTISDLGLWNATLSSTNGIASFAGLMVGLNDAAGTIFDSFATGTINAVGASAGGLVGVNSGRVMQSYATVAVGGGAMLAGGLIGGNSGLVSEVFSNGTVAGSVAGGVIGSDSSSPGSINYAYWDSQLSGQSFGCAGGCSGAIGLTTAQTLHASNFAGFAIDTVGGQTLAWRMYEGSTTPLLKAFLTPITVQPQSLSEVYNATLPTLGVTTYGADPLLVSGTAQVNGVNQNAGTYTITYGGGLYSNQIGYDLIGSATPGVLTISRAPLTLTAVTQTRTYDTTTNSTGVVAVSGLMGSDTISNLTQSFDTANAGPRTLSVNTGYIIADGNSGGNYAVTLQSTTGTITPAPLTLTAVSQTRTYDTTTTSTGAVQVSGLLGTDQISGLSQSYDSPNAGARTLSVNSGYLISDGADGGNYAVTTVTAAGTITPALLNLTAVTQTRTYDATLNSSGVVQVSGLLGSDTIASLTQSFDSTNAGARTLTVNPGYVISDGNNGGNYTVATVTASGSITPAPLTLAAAPFTRTYDATTVSNGMVSANGLMGSDTVSNLSQSFDSANAGARTLTVNAGYVVNDGNGGGNYTVTTQTAAGTITPAPLTLSAVSQTRTYDTTTGSTGVVQTTGLFGSDTVTNLTQSYDSANAGARTLTVNAGYLVNDGNSGGNYTVTLQSASGAITPAPLTLTAVSQTRTYDATNASTGAVMVSGLLGSNSIGNLTQSFDSANAGARTLLVNGNYLINDGNGGGNYAVTLISAAGSITPAPLTLSAVSQTRSYDATTASTGTVQATGLFGSDTVTNLTQAFDSANAGARTLTVNAGYVVNDGNGGGNYTVNTVGAAGTITPAALTLSAISQTRTYNATTGSTGAVQITGLFGSDTVSNATQSFDSANAGARTLTVNAGYLVNDGNNGGNYTVTTQTAAGTITPAPLTLSAVSQTRTYNATTNSTGTVQIAGLLGSDGIGNLTQSFDSANAGARTLSVNGSYVISDGNNGGNYTVTTQSAAGTITPAPLTLSAVSQTRTYDTTTNSTGIVQISGLFGSDTVTNLTQAFDSANAGARSLSVNSGYVVKDGIGGGNYTVSAVSASGTITPAPLTVTYSAQTTSNTYGDPIPILTGTVSVQGLQGSDTQASVLYGGAQFTTTATAQSNVGSYAITGAGLSVLSNNYTATFGQAAGNATALTIIQRPITITAQPVSRPYGQENPALTYVVTGASSAASSAPGLVNGDQLTGSLATTATTSSAAGAYPITQGTLAASPNYAVTYVGAKLTVTGPSLTDISNPVVITVSSVDTSLPGSSGDSGGDGGGGGSGGNLADGGSGGSTDPQRPSTHAKVVAAVRGAVLPNWVPSNLINTAVLNRPRDVTEPVTINGDLTQWSTGGARP